MRHGRQAVALPTALGAASFLVAFASAAPAGEPGRLSDASCPSPSGAKVVRTVRLPGRPAFLLLRGRTLWVAIASPRPAGRGMVLRVDARTGHVQKRFRLPTNPYRVAYGFGSLWVTGEAGRKARRYAGAVLRLDPRTGRILSVIRGPILLGSAIAVTTDAVWVGGGDVYPPGQPQRAGVRFVFQIDPRRNAVVRRVRLRTTTVIDLVADGRSLWATGWGAVVKLSPRGRVVFEQRFDGSGWALALTPGAVWVAQPFFGTRDPRTQRPARRLLKVTTKPRRLTVLELDAPPGLLSASAGVVWMSGPGGLIRIPGSRTPPPLEPVPVRTVPSHVAAFPGGVWGGARVKHEVSKIC